MSVIAELNIDGIAAGGDGVARHDGLVVFVPRAAPGDRAQVRYTTGARFARGEIEDLVHASADRVEPPCPHYTRDRCGGCQLQHLHYDAQLHAKRRIVTDALQRIGRVDAAVDPVAPSPESWRYRRKLTLALRRSGSSWIAGLHPYDAPGRIFPLEDCPITGADVIAVWQEVMTAADLLPRADALRGAVRIADAGIASFTLEGGTVWRTHERFFERVSSVVELWWTPEHGRRRRLHARDGAAEPGASFTQVNAGVARDMRTLVIEALSARSPASVIDAYAGAGQVALELARAGTSVVAIELDADAARYCAARLPAGSRMVQAKVEDVLAALLPADAVVVNPPRAGLHESVTDALRALPPRDLVYVSCNPATLARDLARIPGMRVRAVKPFDMFPQTAHVETVCVLEREEAA